MSETSRGPRPLDLSPFPPVATADWEAAVRRDLKGADYEKRLVWRTDSGIAVKPFYREEDLGGLEAQLEAVPGGFPFVRGPADGRWQIAEAFAPPAGTVRVDLLHDAGATAVQELAYALAEGVERIDGGLTAGQPLDDAAGRIEFVFAVGSHYFLEIAKLRAARMAWAQAVAAFEPEGEPPAAAAMRMHVRTARHNKSTYDAYTNLLRVTTEAMAAVLGGCQALTVEATGFSPHLAVNVQRILDEEAHLGEVADPAAGSYYIEALTDALARAAWRLFQEIEAAGGYRVAVDSGTLAEAVAAARAARDKALATRRRTLVGVNNYPNALDTAPVTSPWPPVEHGVVPAWRMAAPFEALRARTERFTDAMGEVPHVHLVTRGDTRMRTARANFCRNFFGCAGFAITESADLVDADLVVLCSADGEYLALAREIVPATAAPVIVAGNPVDALEALRAAGVQGFVHAASDIVATLTEWQDRLGLEQAS